MILNGSFISDSDRTLSQYLDFSSSAKECYYDHKSGYLMCYKPTHKKKSIDDHKRFDWEFKPLNYDEPFERSVSDLSLRMQYDRAFEFYEKYFGKVNRFNKSDNAKCIGNIRDILIESQRKRERECQSFLSDDEIDDYVKSREKSRISSLQARIKRFGRKAFYNRSKYNWFVTITRDDSLFSSEQQWHDCLCRCFSNLHVRYKIQFQGCFERGEKNDRLHFHAFVFVPQDCDLFNFATVKRYSDKDKKWRICNECDYFKTRFGNNEWDSISDSSLTKYREFKDYMCKYVTKEPVRFFYSRHLPSSVARVLSFNDIYFQCTEYIPKWFVTSEDVLIGDYDSNLKEVFSINSPLVLPFD